MAIDTGLNITYNENFPAAGIDQPSQGFRDNFLAIRRAIEAIQTASTTSASALKLTLSQNSSGDVDFVLSYRNNTLTLPSGDPSAGFPASLGMIRQQSGNLQHHDGTGWRTAVVTNADGGLTVGSTSYFEFPTGDTSQRPATARKGMIRYNNELDGIEYYIASGWTSSFPSTIDMVEGLQTALTNIGNSSQSGLDGKMNISGGNFTGNAGILRGNAYTTFAISATGNNNKHVLFQTGGLSRWGIGSNSSTETGTGNTGSNFEIRRHGDDGSLLDIPLTINRNNGVAAFVIRPTFGGYTAWDAGNFTPSSKADSVHTHTASQITDFPAAVDARGTVAATPNRLSIRDSSGDLTANNFIGQASSARYADVAERYEADREYAPGTVVIFGGEKEITSSTHVNDTALAGIISTAPAFKMNSDAGDDATHPYVALVGRVPCRVKGIIRKGDLLTTGPEGSAQVANAPVIGGIVGKALEDHNDHGYGVIEVSVQRS